LIYIQGFENLSSKINLVIFSEGGIRDEYEWSNLEFSTKLAHLINFLNYSSFHIKRSFSPSYCGEEIGKFQSCGLHRSVKYNTREAKPVLECVLYHGILPVT
jgi:hypothetical protein